MITHEVDVVVIGGGIAGATVAAHLAADRRVALIEAEEHAGYHTTGRSAAMWLLNYGPPDVRILNGLSRAFFENPPPGFTDTPLFRRRAVLSIARADQAAEMDAFLQEAKDIRRIGPAEANQLVPALRPGYVAQAAIEDDAFDMDVSALHQGFLRQLRARGGTVALRHRSSRIERHADRWDVDANTATFRAPIVVDAAGAWADEVATQAGIDPIGLVPKRRTGVIVDPAPWQVADWPATFDVAGTWYIRPEARTRLMVSPADETPMHAHDVQPDELDVAIAIDRMQVALDIGVSRVERQWAGLRTFTPDGSLAFGWAPNADGFFWCVGQGGYGIQTAPAAGQLIADMITGRDPGPAAVHLAAMDPSRFSSP